MADSVEVFSAPVGPASDGSSSSEVFSAPVGPVVAGTTYDEPQVDAVVYACGNPSFETFTPGIPTGGGGGGGGGSGGGGGGTGGAVEEETEGVLEADLVSADSIISSMLGMLPPYLANDPNVQSGYRALGSEYARLEQAGRNFQRKFFPANADDTYRTLGLWEAMLGLPVEPTNATVVARRAQVLSHLRARSVAEGREWVARLSESLGTGWSHLEGPGANQVTIRIPNSGTSYTAAVAAKFARTITPAHIEILVNDGTGFIIGINVVGDDL